MRLKLNLPILLVIAIFVSTASMQQNPNCQPKPANKDYAKTLFVFVVETSGVENQGIKYLMKQFACTIPESNNVKLYILDFTTFPTSPIAVKAEDLLSSQQFEAKVATSLATQPQVHSDTVCVRMENAQQKFREQSIVQGYTDVRYIVLVTTDDCTLPTGTKWVGIRTSLHMGAFRYIQSDVVFKHDETNAPQFLKDSSSKIVGDFLGDASLRQEASASNSVQKSESDNIALFITIAVAVIGWVGFIVMVVVFLKSKKDKKGGKKDNNGDKTKPKNNSKVETSNTSGPMDEVVPTTPEVP